MQAKRQLFVEEEPISRVRQGRKPMYIYPESVIKFSNELVDRLKINRCRSVLVHFMSFISKEYFDKCSFSDINFKLIEPFQTDAYCEKLYIEKPLATTSSLNQIKRFLNSIDIFHLDNSLVNKYQINKPKIMGSIVVEQFVKYLSSFKKFSQPNTYKKHINLLLRFLEKNNLEITISECFDFRNVDEQHIHQYERFLLNKVNKHQLVKNYVYSQLRSIRLFFNYLRREGITDIRYYPPRFLQRNVNRRNDYVEEYEIREMIRLILPLFKFSKFAYRNLIIFLIIWTSGCRPIEVSNLNLSDVFKNEYGIMLKSKKSKKRKFKITKELMTYLDGYLNHRNSFYPIDDSLFVNKKGERLSPVSVYDIFRKINRHLFEHSKHPPVAFRHTFITNACESGNDIKTVASAVGHKHLVSTDSYREKSPHRLRKNSIDHDPTKKFEKEFDYGYTKSEL